MDLLYRHHEYVVETKGTGSNLFHGLPMGSGSIDREEKGFSDFSRHTNTIRSILLFCHLDSIHPIFHFNLKCLLISLLAGRVLRGLLKC